MSFIYRDLKLFSGSSLPISVVTVDFSFALMNAVCRSFNDCSLFLYLELAYRSFVLKESLPIKLTVIASCSVHVIKFFCDKLTNLTRPQKKVVSHVFAKCVIANSYQEFLDNFALLYLVLKQESIHVDLLSEASKISSGQLTVKGVFETSAEELVELSNDFGKDFEPASSQYMNSPFFLPQKRN